MGTRSSFGKTDAEQLSRDELNGVSGAGAPPPVATGNAPVFSPNLYLPVGPNPVGNVGSVEERGPAHFVALSFPSASGRQLHRLPYQEGLPLKHYLRRKRLIGARMSCRLTNGQGRRIRLSYIPCDGETIMLTRVKR